MLKYAYADEVYMKINMLENSLNITKNIVKIKYLHIMIMKKEAKNLYQ
jgi:hypothetical protein